MCFKQLLQKMKKIMITLSEKYSRLFSCRKVYEEKEETERKKSLKYVSPCYRFIFPFFLTPSFSIVCLFQKMIIVKISSYCENKNVDYNKSLFLQKCADLFIFRREMRVDEKGAPRIYISHKRLFGLSFFGLELILSLENSLQLQYGAVD